MLAGLASLSQFDSLLTRVVALEQSFDEEYCGVFRFNIWRYGKWVEVIVDDRLPMREGHPARLLFCRSSVKNEFWTALLEKALAKLRGYYGALKSGLFNDALVDFTGGICVNYSLANGRAPKDLFKRIEDAIKGGKPVGASVVADPERKDSQKEKGLFQKHAYSITRATVVQSRKVNLIRVRNPWGNRKEWTGAWSDKSEEWQSLSETEKQKLELTFEADGEFWMPFDNFIAEFRWVFICHPEILANN